MSILTSRIDPNNYFKIVAEFDQRHGLGISKWSPERNFAVGIFMRKLVQEKLPLEIIERIVDYCFHTELSVLSMLRFYVGGPTLRSHLEILRDDRAREAASRAILSRLGIQPLASQSDLAHTRQLLDIVFFEYFERLSLSEKWDVLRDLENIPWGERSEYEKLAIFKKMTGYNFRIISWQVQLAISRLLRSRKFEWAIQIGSFALLFLAYWKVHSVFGRFLVYLFENHAQVMIGGYLALTFIHLTVGLPRFEHPNIFQIVDRYLVKASTSLARRISRSMDTERELMRLETIIRATALNHVWQQRVLGLDINDF